MTDWHTYIDSHLIGSGKITEAAILGHDGSTWAKSGASIFARRRVRPLLPRSRTTAPSRAPAFT
ncbi:hypothetical protein HNQ79_006675 [Streptomyces candidus]|uniref:Profilin n=1 Tax=Streptomyces candidus TaxID=67283 RepID=A0A7X0HLZ4_9ACTN|nr:hypothetical protein [Streptomyces candidus]